MAAPSVATLSGPVAFTNTKTVITVANVVPGQAYGVDMTDQEQIDLLEGVLTRTTAIIDAVDPAQFGLPTPCEEFDVRGLLDHIVGWAQVFAAGSAGRVFEGDPTTFHVSDDPAAEFSAAAAELLGGWRTHGIDREVRSFAGGMMPGPMIFGMTMMEYLTHGWDLAVATGQEPGFEEAAGEAALAHAQVILLPEYRQPGYFGDEVPCPGDEPAISRLVAFMGRRPTAG